MSAEDAIYEACMLRFRPILMTTMAALLRGGAADGRHRHRLGNPPAARIHHRGRPASLAIADALHDAGGLSVPDRFRVWASALRTGHQR